MSSINQIRKAIVSFEGAEFKCADLPSFAAMHSTLAKMVKWDEISVVRMETPPTGGKPYKVYVERHIKFPTRKGESAGDLMHAWRPVWPEFFTKPALVGTRQLHREWA